ncbi:unnamed protein product [Porites lobata]|uniref:Uncharacterized protein n=1 Tax=Porites lobata TaxID=104759 RepID=A0ABN8P3X1_9CNID|nr:unnamed protein product [Porites lobata]
MADTGVNVGTNAGRVNVPKATEETPSLVLALKPNAEENKGCGAPLAETPGSEEETCEEALLWIDEMMAGMEFPDCPNHSLGERVSQLRRPRTRSRLSDVAVNGRESSVGKPPDKLLLVERDGRGITKDNKKLSSRGRSTTGTTRNAYPIVDY